MLSFSLINVTNSSNLQKPMYIFVQGVAQNPLFPFFSQAIMMTTNNINQLAANVE